MWWVFGGALVISEPLAAKTRSTFLHVNGITEGVGGLVARGAGAGIYPLDVMLSVCVLSLSVRSQVSTHLM